MCNQPINYDDDEDEPRNAVKLLIQISVKA